MASHNKTLNVLATKLGLIEEEKVVNKAAEFERLLQTKSTAGSNMTDTSKTVICLDLAAGIFGADLEVKVAIKYSGLKPAMYTNCRKIVQNLLELNDDKLSTLVVCNTFQCSSVQALADRILEEYQGQAKMELDMNLPQYVCMAVYQACRINKVKLSKSKIIEKSRLKPAQWAKLDADWTKFVDQNFAAAKKKRGRPPKKVEVENGENEVNMEIDIPKIEEPSEPKIEPYEDWKRRMLEAAYKELKMKEAQSVKTIKSVEKTPRRSPRKTPQKFSPYKSPTKGAVRLLFPLNM
ncbi:origin recognition complex subunit 6 [Ostrinia furnacalis]|uniref:origin recognition complex subunit 6 n=1 Tax=Ostrinia furnacalis TaxID=93504 RepID=UPI00103B75AE|nr:origin recognition complex subunit 6 [Ostrinia furnacalis]